MPTAEAPKDLTASSFALLNLTTLTWTEIVNGTGIDADQNEVGVILARNTHASASRTLSITVPQPAESGLDAIGVTPPTNDYTLPANSEICAIANMGAYQDPSSSKITIDASGPDVEIVLLKPVSPGTKVASS